MELQGANLSGADLTEVQFQYAELQGVDFSYADLSAARLDDADLSDAYWTETTCPDGTNADDNLSTCIDNLTF